MSKRQTQSVSPLTSDRGHPTIRKPKSFIYQMTESEGQNQPSRNILPGMAANNDDQSIVNLLKTLVENQNKQALPIPPLPTCYGTTAFATHCHCQMHSNECQTPIQNQSSQNLKADSAVNSEESSIKTLLLTMLKNQSQANAAYTWNQCPTYFRPPPPMLPPCQRPTNHCQHQMQNQSFRNGSTATPSAASAKEDPSTRSILMAILEKQNKMAEKLDILMQMQEIVLKKLDGHQPTHSLPIPSRITFKKIDSVQECQEFEENLKNFDYAQSIIKHFESVCGGASELYGDNVAYALIDHIFTRRLFTLVTWTGVSRGTESKESFLKYERIFQFFFDLVRKTDSEYSIKSLKDFFQKIISNSKRRFEHKRSRISRVKHTFKRKKGSPPDTTETETSYVLLNSNIDLEQELISDEITDNDDDIKDTISIYSNECNTDEVTTIQDLFIKAEDEDEEDQLQLMKTVD